MEILLDVEYGFEPFKGVDIEGLVRFVLERLELPDNTEVSISFVNNNEIAELNEQYRGKVGPTDVLSFECDNLDDDFDIYFAEGDEGSHACAQDIVGEGEDEAAVAEAQEEPAGIYSLGDVIIAPDVVAAQAQGYGNSAVEELELMIVHGLLHLNGYDHIEDDEAAEMESLQTKLLQEWRAQA